MHSSSLPAIALAACSCVCFQTAAASVTYPGTTPGAPAAHREGDVYTLSNNILSASWKVDGSRLIPLGIVNKERGAKDEKAADKGDKARDEAERAKAEAALLDKPVAPEKFYLQAGAFEDPSEADNLKARLALMGVEASVQKVDVPDKGTMHRVRTGPYLGQESMTKARDNLTANGINTAIVKIKPKEPKPAAAAQ